MNAAVVVVASPVVGLRYELAMPLPRRNEVALHLVWLTMLLSFFMLRRLDWQLVRYRRNWSSPDFVDTGSGYFSHSCIVFAELHGCHVSGR